MSEGPTRAEEIDVVEVADGFVVYQPERDRVHFVNHTAAIVLELCDGAHSEEEISVVLQRCYELGEPPSAEVAQCLDRLRAEQLVS